MIVILFRSRLTSQAGDDYIAADAEMMELARQNPGFVASKGFRAEDGERLTVVWWKDVETLRAWREHPRHKQIQQLAREKWYEYYRLEVAEVDRISSFDRPAAATP